MKRKQYREEKIISILKEHEAGASVPELARRHGVAENTIYRWKSKFGGMDVSDAKKLRALEHENLELKRLLAEAELDKAALKELVSGKGNGLAATSGRGPLEESSHQTSAARVGSWRSAVRPLGINRLLETTRPCASGSRRSPRVSALRLPDAARHARDRGPRREP